MVRRVDVRSFAMRIADAELTSRRMNANRDTIFRTTYAAAIEHGSDGVHCGPARRSHCARGQQSDRRWTDSADGATRRSAARLSALRDEPAAARPRLPPRSVLPAV